MEGITKNSTKKKTFCKTKTEKMLVIISDAKKLELDKQPTISKFTTPSMLPGAALLVDTLKKCTIEDFTRLMNVSYGLAELNIKRYAEWKMPFTQKNARQAIYTYNGDVYQGLNAWTFNDEQADFAQDTIRIISGLYGVVRPLDLIQPYRLPMATKLPTSKGKNLYEFWGDHVTEEINSTLADKKSDILINLASNEYFKAINKKKLNAKIITPLFKQEKNGKYRVVSFYAKKARGLMSKFIIENKITKVEDLKNFHSENYIYSKEQSTENNLVFVR